MKIFIPTLGRDKLQTLDSLQWNDNILADTFIVVSKEDEGRVDYPRKLVCPVRGIAKVREFIGEYCKENGIDKFVMMDDDLQFYIRKPGVVNLRYCEPEDIDQMFQTVEDCLDWFSHCAISAREGNNRVEADYADNTRMLRVLAYRTEDFVAAVHNRTPVMEDFDVTLQLLRRGLPNRVWYKFAQGQKSSNADGGCSTYRSMEMQSEAAHRLAELHPGFVRTVKKTTKTAWGGQDRTDVVISWKKAYEDGIASS